MPRDCQPLIARIKCPRETIIDTQDRLSRDDLDRANNNRCSAFHFEFYKGRIGSNIFPSLGIKICKRGIMERRTNFAPGRKCTRLFPLERRGERKSKETHNKENFKRANVHGKFLENRRFASAT